MKVEDKAHERNKPSKKNSCYGSTKERIKTISYEKFPLSVIDIPREFIVIHPTQKPVALIEYLIKTYSNEGETILDNCMGSGTTAIACINTKRNYIGFEIDKEYYDLSVNRIKKYTDENN